MGVRAKTLQEFLEKAQGMHLHGILDRIKLPFLVSVSANQSAM